ncbi:hypothetical protein TRFO_05661 [Tritrichomonas foetus]|uniref:Importin N-terminal domain-containing protein n=1 Tax=Tritrichomonas foetus TaxID=1144522 RepID=A0A1J4K582_9EUKA|nr:hypothetical protein TRFO_05661 [Tritrichomonas foetus]|eukprot:OHT06024.1 hypothetical protein TRFO_05661 [Tritrichomonas foetus]
MELHDFQALLNNTQTNDTEIVQQTTELYQNLLNQNVSGIIILHIQNILSFANPNIVALSIILLKKIFQPQNAELITQINSQALDLIEATLPKFFENPNFTPVHFQLIEDMASLVATKMISHHRMMNFIPHLVTIIKLMNPILSPHAINCVVQCNNYASLIDSNLISSEDVFAIIATVLGNDSPIDFILAALRMLFSFFVDFNKTPQLHEFSPVVSQIYSTITEECLPIALSDLYIFCSHSYLYFKESLPILITSLLSIVTGNHRIHVKSIAIDTFICLARGFCLEFNPFLNDVTAAIMLVSCFFDESNICDSEIEDPYSDDAIFHLSEIFSSRTMYPLLVIKIATDMIQKEEWQFRRAAISAIEKLIMSCETGLDSYIKEIVNLIVPRFADPNPICRCYAYRAFTQLCSQYIYDIIAEIDQLGDLLQDIILASKNEDFNPTKISALEAFEVFCDSCPPETMRAFAEPSIQQILPIIQNQNSSPNEQIIVICCVAKIANSTEINFEPFYQSSISWLKTALGHIPIGQDNSVRIQTIKIFPYIGKIVPLNVFLQDGLEFLQYLLTCEFSQEGDNEKLAILTAFSESAEILANYFQPFLPAVMNLISSIISSELEIERYSISFDVSSLTDRVIVPSREENTIITYSRAQLTLIIHCFDTLSSLSESLQQLVIPFMVPISKIAARYISFSQHSPMQSSCIHFLRSLISLYRKFDSQLLNLYLPFIRKTLYPTITNAFVNSALVLCECIDLFTDAIENAEFDGSITVLLQLLMTQMTIQRQRILSKGSHENSHDLLLIDELELSLERFTCFLLKKFQANMMEITPIFMSMGSELFKMLYMTDVLLLTQQGDLPTLIQMINISLNSTRLNLNYASFISLSRIIRNIENIDPSIFQQTINRALAMIEQYDEDEDNAAHKVIDSALIALSAVFKATYGKIDLSEAISKWFEQMPISTKIDSFDANIAYETLCFLVETKNPIVFNSESLTKLLKCFGTALLNKSILEECHARVIALLKSIFATTELHDLIQQAICELSLPVRRIIKHVIQ